MNQLDTVFLSMGKNCYPYIKNYVDLLQNIKKKQKIKSFIFLSKSSDRTEEFLKKNKHKINLSIISNKKIETMDRLKKMAYGREFLKDYLIKKKIISRYVCVLDIDNIFRNKINSKNFIRCISFFKKNKKKYFAISSNSKPFYYDVFSFCNKRSEIFRENKEESLYNKFCRWKKISNLQKKLSIYNSKECLSSFNGLSLYNYSDYIKSSYLHHTYDKCEHVIFNLKLNRILKKRMVILNYINFTTPQEHVMVNLLKFLYLNLIKKIKNLINL